MTVHSRETFLARWQQRAAARTNLCVGVAPSTRWLTAWGYDDDIKGAMSYCAVLTSVAAEVSAFKVQSPFFERFGPDGLALLIDFTAECRRRGSVVIIDCKRGDSADVMPSIADTFLGDGSVIGADAITALPFLGASTLHPLYAAAATRGCAVMTLVRTSNHEGAGIQTARMDSGDPVSLSLLDEIASWRTNNAASSAAAGAVIGARGHEARTLLQRVPDLLVSLPGLGRGDRSLDEFAKICMGEERRCLLPITSGLHAAGPASFAAEVLRWKEALITHALAPSTTVT